MSSVVIVDENSLTEALQEDAIVQVYEKSQSLGGNCREISVKDSRHICSFGDKNPSLSISVGRNSKGEFLVGVSFTYTHWFPPSRDEVLAGKFVSPQQKELESWLKDVFPASAVNKAVRIYGSYGFELDL